MWENLSLDTVSGYGITAGVTAIVQWLIFFYKQKRDSDLKREIANDKIAIEAFKDIIISLKDDVKLLKENDVKLELAYFEEREENIKYRLENDDLRAEVAKLQKQVDKQ